MAKPFVALLSDNKARDGLYNVLYFSVQKQVWMHCMAHRSLPKKKNLYPPARYGNKYSVLLKKCLVCAHPYICVTWWDCWCAGIIIGPVDTSLKIWFRTPTVCGIYVTETNRRGLWITSCFYDSPEQVWRTRKDPDKSKTRKGLRCLSLWARNTPFHLWNKRRKSNLHTVLWHGKHQTCTFTLR